MSRTLNGTSGCMSDPWCTMRTAYSHTFSQLPMNRDIEDIKGVRKRSHTAKSNLQRPLNWIRSRIRLTMTSMLDYKFLDSWSHRRASLQLLRLFLTSSRILILTSSMECLNGLSALENFVSKRKFKIRKFKNPETLWRVLGPERIENFLGPKNLLEYFEITLFC